MKISCIIPTRDRQEMVLQAVQSVMTQDAGLIEVVVVDDGSCDRTAEALATRWPAIKVIRLSGLGPGPARNAGAEVASGEVLMFLDSDDVWLPHHVDALVAVLNRGFKVAYGCTRTRDEIAGNEFLVPEPGMEREGDLFPALTRWCFLLPSAVAMTKAAFYKAGGFDPGLLAEDWAFSLRLSALYPFGHVDGPPITLRRLHKQSICASCDWAMMLEAFVRVKKVILETGRAKKGDIGRLQRMETLISEEGEKWQTVQDWYLAAKQQGLLDE